MRAPAVRILAALALAAAPAAARPHEIPSEYVMTALLRADPGRAELVVRVPLALLRTMRFPSRPDASNPDAGVVDLAAAGPAVERAAAAVARDLLLADGDRALAPEPRAARLSPASDRSLARWEWAVAHVHRAAEADAAVDADHGFLDVHLAWRRPADPRELSIRTRVLPALRRGVVLSLRYLPARGGERAWRITSVDGAVALDPRWEEAAASFLRSGFRHILDGIDHLLFLLCVVLPIRGARSLLAVVTSFTAAHSVTLAAAALGLAPAGAWFPPLVEVLVAGSIAYLAIENVLVAAPRRRWLATGAFGLVHGFAFASALARDLQVAGDHLAVSLLAFNVGVEAGQLAVLAAALPALWLLARLPVLARHGRTVASLLAALVAWHWLADRLPALRAAVG